MKSVSLLVTVGILFFTSPDVLADAQCERIESKFQVDKASGGDAYDMACCAARKKQNDNAFSYLSMAIDKGYFDHQWMVKDEDLLPLQQDKRWSGMIDKAQAKEKHYIATINVTLYQLYQADQGDRQSQNIDWTIVTKRDKVRRAQVTQMIADGQLKHADDYFHAAMVFQHGDTAQDIKNAWQLALQAGKLDDKHARARWLACAAEDRYLHRMDKPQVWGTQYRRPDRKGPWTMEPFNTTAKTDVQRVAQSVPTLEQAYARLEQMNERLKQSQKKDTAH